jgi:hypothetical protein
MWMKAVEQLGCASGKLCNPGFLFKDNVLSMPGGNIMIELRKKYIDARNGKDAIVMIDFPYGFAIDYRSQA